MVVGAWAALAGYVGPYFGFRPVAHRVWVADLPNGLLHLLPGAVAAAAGLMLLAVAPSRSRTARASIALPALLLVAAGAWLVVGPTAWPVIESGNPFVTGVSALRNLLNVAGASLAPGLVLVLLGGMALKASSSTRRRATPVDRYTPVEAAVPAAPGPVAPTAGETLERGPVVER
ncbi:MAG: hypothetical protein KGQ66_05935 [Acidobacteriota bacterium]|nr:hypothetical protein [Acidobacteriota bacterium]